MRVAGDAVRQRNMLPWRVGTLHTPLPPPGTPPKSPNSERVKQRWPCERHACALAQKAEERLCESEEARMTTFFICHHGPLHLTNFYFHYHQ